MNDLQYIEEFRCKSL